MIVAPMMTPIMPTAAAFVIGNLDRAFRSLLLVGVGVALVIVVSWLIGNLHSVTISYTTDTQIIGRITPKITDLIVALAAGAAGAFAMSRLDITTRCPVWLFRFRLFLRCVLLASHCQMASGRQLLAL